MMSGSTPGNRRRRAQGVGARGGAGRGRAPARVRPGGPDPGGETRCVRLYNILYEVIQDVTYHCWRLGGRDLGSETCYMRLYNRHVSFITIGKKGRFSA